jgi:hypothetical protein
MEGQFSQTLKWLPNLVAFIAACYGIVFQRSVLQSSRPLLPTSIEATTSNRAYARLWDDPFVVFRQDPNPPKRDEAKYLADDAPALLAFVLLDGLSYAEDDELRLRSRFAVQKALADLDYVPENPEVLESLPYPLWLRTSTPSGPEGEEKTSPTLKEGQILTKASYAEEPRHVRNIASGNEEPSETRKQNPDTENSKIPFQDFRLRPINRFADTDHLLEKPLPAGARCQYGRIRVFWLDEDLISAAALRDLPGLLALKKNELACKANPHGRCKEASLSVVLLGPSDSASLTEMVRLRQEQPQPADCAGSTKTSDPGSDVRVINYQATAANDYVKLFAYHQKCLSKNYKNTIKDSLETIRAELEEPLLGTGPENLLRIERTGCSDYQLCEALLGEVHRRTPFFVQRKPKILVFYETDTFYGRALALTLETLAKFPYPAHPSPQSEQLLSRLFSNSQEGAPFKVELIGYFRGLDGFSSLYHKQYVSAQAGSSGGSEASSSGGTSKSVGLDRGEGSSQFDYIKRICNSIDRNDPPCAIALLGTDIFDKLSLLSILHERLPDALYLSTELDSRYLAPENLAFTRNLIVASPFGLSPIDEKGRKPARSVSFRDSNQTALYTAVQSSVLGTETSQKGPDLYEIGNSHAVQMPANNSGQNAFETRHESLLDGTNPAPSMLLQTLAIVTGILFLFFAIQPVILKARDFPAELAEPLREALKTADLRKLADCLCRLKGEFECRWTKTDGVNEDIPDLSPIRAAGSGIKEPALKALVGSETKQLEDGLNQILARRQSSYVVRTLQDIYSKDVTKTRFLQNLCCTVFLGVINYLQGESEKAVFGKFKRNLENVLLSETYVDAKSFPELDSLNCYRRLPGTKMTLLELCGVTAVTILFFVACRRLAPYSWGLAGFELRNSFEQLLRAILGFTEVWLTLWITLIVCREQLVCETLIRKFSKFINKASGLTSRRTILVIALRSDPVSKLSMYPCSLLFLLFVAHMRSLQGAPTTVAHAVGAFLLLLLLFVMSNQVRTAANDAKSRCLTEYKIDSLKAERARATLASVFGNENLPLQDSLARVVEDVNQLGQKNSLRSTELKSTGKSPNFILSKQNLATSESRQNIIRYLEALIERNSHVIDFISKLQSGALTSLILSPLAAALLIPIGGAGGLTILDYLTKLFRG